MWYLRTRIITYNMSLKEKVKLTHYSKGGGWACKIGPGDLAQVLSKINKQKNDNVIVDFEQSDDAAVIDIGNDKYLVQTVDFFSPIVDDPFTFGQIAAANSLSDIYAMGAKPLFALNIVGFPTKELSNDIYFDIGWVLTKNPEKPWIIAFGLMWFFSKNVTDSKTHIKHIIWKLFSHWLQWSKSQFHILFWGWDID